MRLPGTGETADASDIKLGGAELPLGSATAASGGPNRTNPSRRTLGGCNDSTGLSFHSAPFFERHAAWAALGATAR